MAFEDMNQRSESEAAAGSCELELYLHSLYVDFFNQRSVLPSLGRFSGSGLFTRIIKPAENKIFYLKALIRAI